MGRAPNPGAPQRVSAHVVPKGQPFSAQIAAHPSVDDEEEKTTIESGWEEEASTTVEQGEVAEKIRQLGLDPPRRQAITNVTSNSGIEEPTADDQRANAALSMITPPTVLARLIITHGNDNGQETEIIPGKNYTVGRAIDNDVVLTDIAVSRKHFDLRHEGGAWVLADRGSGNGTLVNGNLEDQPFMLANGDLIEIGNTTFKFDFPNAPPRNAFADNQRTNGYDGKPHSPSSFEIDEEEPSTVAGKPLHNSSIETPQTSPPALRSKTVPPPAPIRPRPVSHPPPISYPNGSAGPVPAALQPTVAPHHGMPALNPQMLQSQPGGMHSPMRVLGSQAPTMLGDPNGMPLPNVMPTTIPGQGLPVQPSQPHVQALPFTYPNVADHAMHAKMLVASNQLPRDATATAHVQPVPYSNGMQQMNMQVYTAPTLSRRTKLLLGGAGLALLAAIATVAIIKAASGGDDEVPTEEAPPEDPPKKGPVVQPIDPPKKDPPKVDKIVTTPSDPKKDPPKVDKIVTTPSDPKKDPAKDPPKDPVKDPKKDPPKVEQVVVKDPPKDPPKKDPPKKDPPKDPPPVVVKKDPPKKDPAKKDPPKKDPPPVVVKKDPPKKDPPKKDPPKKDPPPVVVKKDPPKKDPPKKDPPKKDPPKRVAASDNSEVKTTASAMYRNRKFADAANLLRAAAAKTSGGSATELKTLAGMYEGFGRNFNVGMAPQTKPDEAWDRLTTALSFDKEGAYREEISSRRAAIAGKAAIAFTAARNYSKALQAVRVAEANGNKQTGQFVRSKIEDHAAELYNAAAREIDSNPKDAKQKLQQVKALVEPKSQWYIKADKMLNGL